MCHVGRKWCESSMVNSVYVVVWRKVSYVIRLGRNCCISTWIAIKRQIHNTNLSNIR
jgi:hypothetical protein|uniref:Uncharacterized protein n=1 Tax=Picea glauca TaxID=3330 RepID=A0A101M1Z7_PICGL|nr:hypothetical protein ABT39_MTgene2801 [Picea glauca]